MSVRVVAKKLSFVMEPAGNLPEGITVDSTKLRQVLINLIANGVKYTEKGKIIFRVKTIESESSQLLRLRFEVQDSGIGIRKEDQKIIFSSFEQIGDQPAAEAGTGLGLAICLQFIELMGGHLGVSSKPGEGALFYFEIPVSVCSISSQSSTSPHHRHVTGLVPGQQHYRLLIAEDKLENRLLLRNLLEPLGFDLREVVNGQEAVVQCKEWQPHLIWMDIRMPVMDGLEATRFIKNDEAGSNTKIVALTAHALEEERLEILEVTLLLDKDQCLQVAGEISDCDLELGRQLRRMIEDLQYKKIMMILDNL